MSWRLASDRPATYGAEIAALECDAFVVQDGSVWKGWLHAKDASSTLWMVSDMMHDGRSKWQVSAAQGMDAVDKLSDKLRRLLADI